MHLDFVTRWMTVVISCALLAGCTSGPVKRYDVVVYGGTAGGTIAAIAAAEKGVSVVLLEPRRHIGGMVSGGLGRTDFGNKAVIGGMSREFFIRAGQHYEQPIAWYFEPHVATQIFHSWLNDAGVDVLFDHRLDLDSVTKCDNRITRIRMENGTTFEGDVFIDATYEGDLMARADVAYTWGREGRDVYGESLAGRHQHSEKHQFDVEIKAHDENGRLLPRIYEGDPTEAGQGDRKVQAYNFRLCLTDDAKNQVAFPKPADYDAGRYELLKRYLQAKGASLELKDVILIFRVTSDKTDINNKGPFSTDHIGGSWDYPEADYQRREEIWNDHVSYVQGFLYFMANDPSVPEHLQAAMNEWGLAADEFVDTNHWPHQMYIREARRMVGAYVMRQADLQTQRTKLDSIGMGSYNSDSHHVQRIATLAGFVTNEGDMQVPVQPYEIAYRAITPKKTQCANLLVPVCFSASHVAYSSMRMEPQYMIMGEAAGLAATYAVRNDCAVQDVSVASLQQELRQSQQVLSLAEVVGTGIQRNGLRGIVVDNSDARKVGGWLSSTSAEPFVGVDYIHNGNESKGASSVRYVPMLPTPGWYEVRVAYTCHPNRASRVPIVLKIADGVRELSINQQQASPHMPFISLGAFQCEQDCYLEIRTDGTDGYVVADAVQWIPCKSQSK